MIAFAGDALVCVFTDPEVRNNINMMKSPTLQMQKLKQVKEHGDSIRNFADSFIDNERYVNTRKRNTIEGKSSAYYLNALYAALCLVCCETAELTAHAALSCGEMSIATVGGHDNEWTYLLNGSCISELSCIDDAKSREVVITSKLYDLLKELDSEQPTSKLFDDPNDLDLVDFSSSKISRLESGNFLVNSIHVNAARNDSVVASSGS